MRKLGAIVMVGAGGPTPQEQLVARMQQAATLDLVLMLKQLRVAPIILSAPRLDWWPDDIHIWLAPDPEDRPFHFGSYLAETVVANDLDQALYFGGASAPLLDYQMLHLLLDLLRRATDQHIVLSNNIHSSDWVGISRIQDAVGIIRALNRDNSLAWTLREEGHYEARVLTDIRQAAGFDLDTPTDLAIIRQHPECGPNLRKATNDPRLDAIPVQAILDILQQPGSHLALFGRVAPKAWEALSHATQTWIRVFSEERGMTASERKARGEVRSLLGALIEQQGPQAFFQMLSDTVDAAIIDTRVLMAHHKLDLTDADRFASDLYMIDAVQDPWLREFTAAALDAAIPIILGGHSAVAGGLCALSEVLELPKATAH